MLKIAIKYQEQMELHSHDRESIKDKKSLTLNRAVTVPACYVLTDEPRVYCAHCIQPKNFIAQAETTSPHLLRHPYFQAL